MEKKMNKVKEIIRTEFDERVALMALAYTLGQLGMDNAAKLTEEDISSMEGNAFMTKEFCQALAKTAMRIGKECSFTDDVIPYILGEFEYLKKKDEEEELIDTKTFAIYSEMNPEIGFAVTVNEDDYDEAVRLTKEGFNHWLSPEDDDDEVNYMGWSEPADDLLTEAGIKHTIDACFDDEGEWLEGFLDDHEIEEVFGE